MFITTFEYIALLLLLAFGLVGLVAFSLAVVKRAASEPDEHENNSI